LGTSGIAFAEEARQPPGWIVSAASCQPASPADAAKLNLFHGVWLFDGNSVGTATLTCALPFPTGSTWTNVDVWYGDRSKAWYRDSDGTSPTVQILAELFRRWDTGSGYTQVGTLFNSNGFTVTTDTAQFWYWSGYYASTDSGFAFIRVTLKRTYSSQVAAFGGLQLSESP
jgi:hypothetical protein